LKLRLFNYSCFVHSFVIAYFVIRHFPKLSIDDGFANDFFDRGRPFVHVVNAEVA
jgi:hypothetical protein